MDPTVDGIAPVIHGFNVMTSCSDSVIRILLTYFSPPFTCKDTEVFKSSFFLPVDQSKLCEQMLGQMICSLPSFKAVLRKCNNVAWQIQTNDMGWRTVCCISPYFEVSFELESMLV